jgi:hypothetical protein
MGDVMKGVRHSNGRFAANNLVDSPEQYEYSGSQFMSLSRESSEGLAKTEPP